MDPLSNQVQEAIGRLKPSVVRVRAKGYDDDGDEVYTVASGILLDRAHVLTSLMTIADAKEIEVTTYDGEHLEASEVGADDVYYLGVLELDGEVDAPPAEWADSDEAQLGTAVVTVGCARSIEHYSASMGIVSGRDRTIYRPDGVPIDGLFLTDASVHPGNTGGALGLLDGRVIGLNGIPYSHGLGIVIEGNLVQRLAHQILDYGQATHAWIGIEGQRERIDRTLVDLFSLPVDQGLTIQNVVPGGPADRAGLKPYDMIVRVNGARITQPAELRRRLSSYSVGSAAPITVLRGGELVDVHVAVEDMPRDSGASFFEED